MSQNKNLGATLLLTHVNALSHLQTKLYTALGIGASKDIGSLSCALMLPRT